MSDVKRCDRCYIIYTKSDIGLIVCKEKVSSTTLAYYTKPFDLCNSCKSLLKKWMEK